MSERIRLGDELGYTQEPGWLYARVVGIRKDDCPPMKRIIFRRYAPGDRLGVPTGEHRTGWLVTRWERAEEPSDA
jgi:hypothetical protein